MVEAESGRLDPSQHKPIAELRRKSYRSFAEGDVLFAKVTPCMENGKIALASGLANGVGFGSSEFHVLRPRTGIVAKYLMHFLLQKRYRDDARRDMSGTAGLLRVSAKYLETSEIPVPPLGEQERIVAAIEEQFSRLDAGVAALEHARQNLKRMANRAAEYALTGALKLARGQEQSADAELPRSWSWGTWEAVLAPGRESFRRGPFGSAITKAMFVASGYRVYEQYAAINDDCEHGRYYLTDEDYRRLSSFAVKGGDFLISCSGTIGRITCVPEKFHPGVINQALLRVRLNEQLMLPAYFVALVRSPYFQSQMLANSTGTAMTNVKGVADLKAIPIPIPPVQEQPAILEWLSDIQTAVEHAVHDLDRVAARATSLRSSVLTAAFSGKLVSQHASDEPAFVLLQRITTERASSNGRAPTPRRVPHPRVTS